VLTRYWYVLLFFLSVCPQAATYDSILLCEHAGFSLVLVETVGVGQSEVSVHSMVDLLILLVQPGGGDELQGMKKGLVELIDLVVVNKADGELLSAARHTKLDYAHALQLNTRRKKDTDWKPTVKLCSSIHETGGKHHNASQHAVPREDAAAAAGASSPATASRQQQQLRDIWLSVCAFDEWARGPLGDFHVRRARQADALLKQALRSVSVSLPATAHTYVRVYAVHGRGGSTCLTYHIAHRLLGALCMGDGASCVRVQ